MGSPLLLPDPADARLTARLEGVDQDGRPAEAQVIVERPLTLFLNGREIVTMMTIGDHPDYLAVGYLLNQNMLLPDDEITAIDYDDEIDTVVVRTARTTDYEAKLGKKVLTSGCAQGTVFGDVMEKFETITLDAEARLKTSWLYALTRAINTTPSLYLAAGAIHGCVLCEGGRMLIYMEDVGRHNAVDKVVGWALAAGRVPLGDCGLHVSGRLGFEIVQKAVVAGLPLVAAVGAASSLAVDLALRHGLTLATFLRPGRMNLYGDPSRVTA